MQKSTPEVAFYLWEPLWEDRRNNNERRKRRKKEEERREKKEATQKKQEERRKKQHNRIKKRKGRSTWNGQCEALEASARLFTCDVGVGSFGVTGGACSRGR